MDRGHLSPEGGRRPPGTDLKQDYFELEPERIIYTI